MGAWGHGSFQNDCALDWLAELEAGGIEAIREALQPSAHEYIEVDDASNAIAAAVEIVAAARGHGADNRRFENVWILEGIDGRIDEINQRTGDCTTQAPVAYTALLGARLRARPQRTRHCRGDNGSACIRGD